MRLFQLTYDHSTLGKRISFHPTKKVLWDYYATAKKVARENGTTLSQSACEEITIFTTVQGIALFLNKKVLEIQKIAKG